MRRIYIGLGILVVLVGGMLAGGYFYQQGQERSFLERAEAALAAGDPASAIQLADQGLVIRPEMVQQEIEALTIVRGKAHFETENWQAAIDDLTVTQAIDSDDELLFIRAVAYAESGQYEASLVDLESLADDSTAEVIRLRGENLLALGDLIGAYEVWATYPADAPDAIEVANGRFELADQLDDDNLRVEAAEAILAIDPASTPAQEFLMADVVRKDDLLTASELGYGSAWPAVVSWLNGRTLDAAELASGAEAVLPRAILAAEAGSIEALNQAVADAQTEAEYALAVYIRGRTLIDLGQLDAALADAEQLIASENPYWGYVLRGTVNLAREAYPQGIFDFDQALGLIPTGGEGLIGRSNGYYLSGDLGASRADLASAIGVRPNSVEANRLKAALDTAEGELEVAIEVLGLVLEADPDDLQALNDRATLYAEIGQFELAIADDGRILALDPDNFDALSRRGANSLAVGDAETAVADFSEALILAPNNADLYIGRAQGYRSLGQLDAAVQDATRALQFDRDNALAYLILGIQAVEEERFFDAVINLTDALELDEDLAEAYAYRAEAYFFLNEIDRARPDATRALELDDGLAQSHMAQAFIYAFERDWRSAIDEADLALDIEPENVRILGNRGLLYLDAGDYNRALDDFNQLLDLDPTYLVAYIWRAEAQIELQRYQDALDTYQDVIAADPAEFGEYLDLVELAESRTVDLQRIPESVDGIRVWVDGDHGFEIAYPEDWLQFVDPGEELPVTLLGPLDKDYRATFNLAVIDGVNLTVSQLSRAFDPPSTLNDFEELENRSVLIGGRSAIRKSFSWTAFDDRLREIPITVVQIYMLSGDEAYLFSASMRSEDVEKYEPIFDEMFDSFAFSG